MDYSCAKLFIMIMEMILGGKLMRLMHTFIGTLIFYSCSTAPSSSSSRFMTHIRSSALDPQCSFPLDPCSVSIQVTKLQSFSQISNYSDKFFSFEFLFLFCFPINVTSHHETNYISMNFWNSYLLI